MIFFFKEVNTKFENHLSSLIFEWNESKDPSDWCYPPNFQLQFSASIKAKSHWFVPQIVIHLSSSVSPSSMFGRYTEVNPKTIFSFRHICR